MTDAALDRPVLIRTGEFGCVGRRKRVRRAIRVALQRDGWHGNPRSHRQSLLDGIEATLALGEAEPPAVIVDDDRDMVRIVESCRRAGERRVVERPLRRAQLPDQPRKCVPVLLIAKPSAFGGEIELIPPLQLRLRR